jgi:hypothetical protein
MTALLMLPKKLLFGAIALVVVAAAAGGFYFLRGDGGGDAKSATPVAQTKKYFAPPVPTDEAPSEAPTADELDVDGNGAAPDATVPPDQIPTAVPSGVPARDGDDGCDHAYGVGAFRCLPWTLPDGAKTVEQKCAFLKKSGFPKISVPGRDRFGLDPDHDKIACNKL